MAHLLIVDDEPSICWALARLGEKLGHRIRTAGSGEEALDLLDRAPADLIFLDVRLPGRDGLALLPDLRKRLPGTPIVVMTAYGDLRTAVEAVRGGAFEYLVKPFELDAARRLVERALPETPPPPAPPSPPAPERDALDRRELVGKCPAMQEVFKRIALVAPSNACVYLSGESGTGKELVARAVHRYGKRSEGPFVAVNVAALSPTLAESELFGHVKGAFTGADQPRRGLLEQAHGGTIFLDEVADIPPAIQVKLLRALEYGEVLPVGSDRPLHADFRLVCASHRDLGEAITAGQFRHDLYFRLSTFRIHLPPLRERRDDIAELAVHFVADLCRRNRTPPAAMSHRFKAELERRPWSGNVRELRNAIEHALILARGGALEPEHLPAPAAENAGPATHGPEELRTRLRRWADDQLRARDDGRLYERLLDLVEPPVLEAALEAGSRQCTAAARLLGLHRTTLKKKADQYGLRGEN